MVSGIAFLCSNYKYTKKFRLGVGLLYYSLENVISNVQHTKRAKI